MWFFGGSNTNFFAHVFFHSELSRFWPAEGKENWKRKVTDWTLESRYQKHTSIHGKQYSRNSRPQNHKNYAFYSLIILIYFSTYWLQFFINSSLSSKMISKITVFLGICIHYKILNSGLGISHVIRYPDKTGVPVVGGFQPEAVCSWGKVRVGECAIWRKCQFGEMSVGEWTLFFKYHSFLMKNFHYFDY